MQAGLPVQQAPQLRELEVLVAVLLRVGLLVLREQMELHILTLQRT